MGLTAVSLVACGAKDDASKLTDKAKTKVKTTADAGKNAVKGYSKADFMKACETSMTTVQCDCYVDFYKSIGLEVKDLGDQAKVASAMQSLKPKDAMKVAKCVQ